MPNEGYRVGYGKPPEEYQFKQGQSGNPKGRPKGSKNNISLLNEALGEKVTVTGHGKEQKVSKRKAMFTQLVNKAIKGDLRAMELILKQTEKYQETDKPKEKTLEEILAELHERN